MSELLKVLAGVLEDSKDKSHTNNLFLSVIFGFLLATIVSGYLIVRYPGVTMLNNIGEASFYIFAFFVLLYLLGMGERESKINEIITNDGDFLITKEEKDVIEKIDPQLINLEGDSIHKSLKYSESWTSLGYFKDIDNPKVYLGMEKFINNGKLFKDGKPLEYGEIRENEIISALYIWVDQKECLDKIFTNLEKNISKDYKIVKPKNPKNILILLEGGFENKKIRELIGQIKINLGYLL